MCGWEREGCRVEAKEEERKKDKERGNRERSKGAGLSGLRQPEKWDKNETFGAQKEGKKCGQIGVEYVVC